MGTTKTVEQRNLPYKAPDANYSHNSALSTGDKVTADIMKAIIEEAEREGHGEWTLFYSSDRHGNPNAFIFVPPVDIDYGVRCNIIDEMKKLRLNFEYDMPTPTTYEMERHGVQKL